MSPLPKVTVLISGRGSNLRSLITNAAAYKINEIISDKADAPGLQFGSEFGIKATAVPAIDFKNKAEFKKAVFQAVKESNPDFVCLAGYMQIIQPDFVQRFFGRLINIHPSLLPAFPGLHTHERALEAQAKEHGCSVHFVDSGVDTGPIIAQCKVVVDKDDSLETLSARVLAKEHLLYPWVLNNLASAEISLAAGKVLYSAKVKTSAKANQIELLS